ncbi:MAG: FAD-binding oxidoreductase [Holophagaceae bacterium]|nr:FAD-binding oxidoreductase [Holophagaceae bacterium]
MTTATATSLRDSLVAIVGPDRVLDRPVDLIAFASDASFYRLIPKAVAFAGSVEDVRGLFRLSHEAKIPMTFRAAGTSLSGQSVSDGILVEVARNWRGIQVLEGGAKVKVQPGVIGAHVNHALKFFKAKMGPDPASINTCTVGGILSNNSSGMCCGVTQNAYHTLESLTFVLPSGTVIDTAAPDADARFREAEPELTQGLLNLKADLLANPALAERIRAKYKMKNTTGYSLNAFIDFDRPVDIFRNVLVGSEGTLAFIAEAVLKSVPDLPVKVTAFLLFPDLHAACAAIIPLRDAGAAALELLDRASLKSVENQPGIPPTIKTLPDGAAALLVEFHGRDESVRADLERTALATTAGLKLMEPARFTHDPVEQALFWKIRSGTFPSVGAVRKRGTTVLIEDVAFPIESLADAAVDLTKLFAKHGYDEAIIFGHAKDGNLHFVITQSFNDQAAVDRYERFIDDVVELVVKKYDGALKAEHGTGRNMAPFVEAEWGPEAKAVMEKLKALVDPLHLLNPGVIINADPKCHVADLKPMPGVEEEVDKCIECGYCEPKCPSRELTLTPRQRIVVRREMARLESSRENPALLSSLQEAFPYMALDTCAADGLCATACPVSIDTGQLTKRFRRASHSRRAQKIALSVARNFATVEPVMRVALRSGHLVQGIFGNRAMPFITRIMKAFGASHQWSPEMPKAAKAPLPVTSLEGAQAIYFPACISRMMGHLPGEPEELSLVEALVKVSSRAGVPVHIPLDVEGTCCGVPFSSKGFDLAHKYTVNHAIEKFWEWSQEGRLSIVMDTSPCTYGVVTSRSYLTPENQAKFDKLKIIDSTAFAYDVLLPKLQVARKVGSVVLHPVCSLTKMNLLPKLEGVAQACADKVVVPRDAGCCGFAGDRGFTHAELTASATKHEAKEVKSQAFDGHYASSRTCEVGMTRSTGEIYRSFLYLLESATRPEVAK